MNHWLITKRKKEMEAIKSFVESISPIISFLSTNLYPTHHMMRFRCNDIPVDMVRIMNQWEIRTDNKQWYSLDDYGTSEFWRVIESCVQYCLKPPIEFVDD